MRVRRPGPSSRSSYGSGLDLTPYGLPGLPALDPDLPGETVHARALGYVEALGMATGVGRGRVLFAAECVLDDFERERDGRPSYEAELLERASSEGDRHF